MSSSLYKAPVNNAGLDPLQAFDAQVYTLDQATGAVNLIGGFRNAMVMVRNATEPYLELGQRIARNLDGEIQIAFVLDRGMISADWLERTFGYSQMTREAEIKRNTRFQITINYNAAQLAAPSGDINFKSISSDFATQANALTTTRQAQGKNVLLNCKIDSLTSGIQAGRSVIDMRWEGIAEGIVYSNAPDTTVKEYLNAVNTQVTNFYAPKASRSPFTLAQ